MTYQESLFESDDNTSTQRNQSAAKLNSAVSSKSKEPLAARMRPRKLDEIIGQPQILGPDKILRRSIEGDKVTSMILWGPPGSGKTTLAEVIALHTHAHFVRLNATSAGVADLRKVVEEAKHHARTILFIDEIHRFNKAQQDAILPHVERGTVTLIGATTENPSFEVNSALLSRSRVFVLKALTEAEIELIMQRAIQNKERGLGQYNISIDENALQQIAIFASGDARTALNVLELAVQGALGMQENNKTSNEPGKQVHITLEMVEDAMQHRALQYDKAGEQHYDMISALHKAVRGSDPDGSIYWLVRMLEGGEDPLYLARRMMRMAAEDIGMADPQALVVCTSAQQAVHFVGMPEAGVILAQAVVYLATAPKSAAVYAAYNRVRSELQNGPNDPVPLWIRNAPTKLMKNLGYGEDYKYAHDYYKDMESEDPERPPTAKLQEYLPERMVGQRFYEPGTQGKERSIRQWLQKRHGGS